MKRNTFFSRMTLDDPEEAQLTRDCSSINLDSIYSVLELYRQQKYNYWGYNSYEDLTLMNQPALYFQGLTDLSQPARLSYADLLKIKNEYNKNWEIIAFEDADHFLMTGMARCLFSRGEKLYEDLHYQVDWETPTFNWLDDIVNN